MRGWISWPDYPGSADYVSAGGNPTSGNCGGVSNYRFPLVGKKGAGPFQLLPEGRPHPFCCVAVNGV
ncbi:MAG: hypothetical protein CM15mP103_06300 [Gammaproteobacteria bacterium]|nr:MAG: hypothetical protein CM15mP103_06300 [Gammaproteobacteria bacterium]